MNNNEEINNAPVYQTFAPWWAWVIFSVLVAFSAGLGAYYIFKDQPFSPTIIPEASPTPTVEVAPTLTEDQELDSLQVELNNLSQEDSSLPPLPSIDLEQEI